MLDPSGGGAPPQGDPRIAAVMQMLQAAAMQRQQGEQAPAPFTPPLHYPDSPADLSIGGRDPVFHGQPLWQGGGGPAFGGGPVDQHAAGRHRARNAPRPMDPQRALAIQEMGKYLQAWGKLHQQHGALHEAVYGSDGASKGN